LTFDLQDHLQDSAKKLGRKAKVILWVAEVVEGEDGSRQRWVLGQGPSRHEDPGLRAAVLAHITSKPVAVAA